MSAGENIFFIFAAALSPLNTRINSVHWVFVMSLHQPIYKSMLTPTSSCSISWSIVEQGILTTKTGALCTMAEMTFLSITQPVYVAEANIPHFSPWFGGWSIGLWHSIAWKIKSREGVGGVDEELRQTSTKNTMIRLFSHVLKLLHYPGSNCRIHCVQWIRNIEKRLKKLSQPSFLWETGEIFVLWTCTLIIT